MRRILSVSLLALTAGLSTPLYAQDAIPASEEEAVALAQGLPLSGDDERIKALILETLVANPDVLVEALTRINEQQMEARAAIEAREDRIRAIAANEDGAPVTGNPEGDVTIVYFSDYNCPHCREAQEIIRDVVAQDGNVRVVHRELPILGPDSLMAAKAALAADMQGKYEPFHDALMGLTDQANTQTLLKVALDAGVDLNVMLRDQDKDPIVRQIESSRAIAEEFGFAGTPAFFIGTTVASGAPAAADLRAAIQAERDRQTGG